MKNKKLRVISVAWGLPFLNDLLSLSLPSLNSRDNLPYLSKYFTVTVVLVTESKFFDFINQQPIINEFRKYCNVDLISLDDLIKNGSQSYGMALTYSLFRGFENLNEDMLNCYLLFLNSDFILADGSYKNLLPHLLNEEKIIVAPSYCANKESVVLHLKNISTNNHISISNRKMADLILKNKQLSIISKTINQLPFQPPQSDQFYYAISRNCMLGIQLPIAVVAIKPTVFLKFEDIQSLWDYGLIEDFCPNTSPLVLFDSDEFLMMELRETERGLKDLTYNLGINKSAENLKNVITKYTVQYLNKPLILHSTDINLQDILKETQFLEDYAKNVIDKIKIIPSHKNHIQWVSHFESFHLSRNNFLQKNKLFSDSIDGDISTYKAVVRYDNNSIFLYEFANLISKYLPLHLLSNSLNKFITSRNLLIDSLEKNNTQNETNFATDYFESSQYLKNNFNFFMDLLNEEDIGIYNKNSLISDEISFKSKNIFIDKLFLNSIKLNYPFFHPSFILTRDYEKILLDTINIYSNILYITGSQRFKCLKNLRSKIIQIDLSDLNSFSRSSLHKRKFNTCIIEGGEQDLIEFSNNLNLIVPLLVNDSNIIAIFLKTDNKTLSPIIASDLFKKINFSYCGPYEIKSYYGFSLDLLLSIRYTMIFITSKVVHKKISFCIKYMFGILYIPFSLLFYVFYKFKFFFNYDKNIARSKLVLFKINV